MYGQKIFLVTTLLATVVLAKMVINPKSHNFTIGFRQPGDRLVLEQNIEIQSKLWQLVTLVKTFNATKFTRITKLEAIDRRTDGTGATVTLLTGGPSYPNATLRFKSKRSHGIHFKVNLYAR